MAPTIKKVVLFGSTGNTGRAVLDYAIKQGYEVTVLVRDASRLPETPQPHRVVVGDVLKKEDVDKAVQGQDGVVVVLGTRNELSPTTALSDGLKNILQSMSEHGVKRISVCISSFLFWERAKVPAQFIPLTEDHERMFQALKACDREWVAIFPPHIAGGRGAHLRCQAGEARRDKVEAESIKVHQCFTGHETLALVSYRDSGRHYRRHRRTKGIQPPRGWHIGQLLACKRSLLLVSAR